MTAAAVKTPRFRIRRDDEVIVLSGKDRGKSGKVLKVMPAEARVIVQGINVVKRHQRPTGTQAGGIVEKEASIHISNVAHIDPSTRKATRVGVRTEDGRKVRFARKSGELIDR